MDSNATNGSDERQFLHDLASPLGTAIFLADSVLDGIQSRPGFSGEDIDLVIQIQQALERVKVLLEGRREALIKRGVPSARA